MSDEASKPHGSSGAEAEPPAASEHPELERLLLRSAEVDVPPAGAKERALEAGLAAMVLTAARKRRVIVFGAAAATLSIAALAALFLRANPEPKAVAERVITEPPAPAAPAPAASLSVAPLPLSACSELAIARGDAPLIEDWEAKNSTLLLLDGRTGSWVNYDDGTGKQNPPVRSPLFPSRIPGGRDASKNALHLHGGRYTNWGVTFGAELAEQACYDASAYAGIEFWAKGPGKIKIGVQMIDVQDVKYGGLCRNDCYNSHRSAVTLGKSFQKFTIRWDDLKQLYQSGTPIPLDPKRIRFLEFGIAAEDTPFDVWVDDVSFLPR
jgi:hypothetical protein